MEPQVHCKVEVPYFLLPQIEPSWELKQKLTLNIRFDIFNKLLFHLTILLVFICFPIN